MKLSLLLTTILLGMITEGVAAKKCKKSHIKKFDACLENGFRSSIQGCKGDEGGKMAKQEKKECKQIEKKMKKCNQECIRCPEYVPIVACVADPCLTAECVNSPDASYTPNYCGECAGRFYDERGDIICALLSEVDGEIKPASVSQSSTVDDDDAGYGIDKAIDRDLNTYTLAPPGEYDSAWFKASLDGEYCIEKVVHYLSNVQDAQHSHNTYTCCKDTCTCDGILCAVWSLSVYREDGTVPGGDIPSGCKIGDTVKIENRSRSFYFVALIVQEIAIIGKLASDDKISKAGSTSEDDHCGWIRVLHDTWIDFDLEATPLEIKTNSELGRKDTLHLSFYSSEYHDAGGVYLYFTSTPQYRISYCNSTSGKTNFPTNLPSATDKVWRITVTRVSGYIILVIHCNEVEVLNTLVHHSNCNRYLSTVWNRDKVKLNFPSWDAADYYRPQPGI